MARTPCTLSCSCSSFESLPTSIIEAGRIDGCTQLETFFYIVLPLSKPICSVIAIFAINAAWSDFLLPYLVLRGSALQTVMVRLFVFSTEQTVNADTMMRSVVFSMIPPIILFFIFAFIVLLFLRYQSGVDLPPRRPENYQRPVSPKPCRTAL